MFSRSRARARRRGVKPSTASSKREVARRRLSLQRRRARALLFVSGLFAIVVLVTSMPVSALISQHVQLSSTARQVGSLEAQNKALEQEAKQLSDPSTVVGIARRDYGLVAPGSQVYEILPPSGASTLSAQSSGHVPLEGPPVAPGSARSQELLSAGNGEGAGAASAPVWASSSSAASVKPRSSANAAGRRATRQLARDAVAGGGFWARVAGTLEFWR